MGLTLHKLIHRLRNTGRDRNDSELLADGFGFICLPFGFHDRPATFHSFTLAIKSKKVERNARQRVVRIFVLQNEAKE